MTLAEAAEAIRAREPIFHRPEFGTKREDYDQMMAADFAEIGASGKHYPREFILDTLEDRHRVPQKEELEISDFTCRQLADDLYLANYAVESPPGRLTRRSTIWRHAEGSWKIVFHQGTVLRA